jgi:hypothetical protein
MFGVLALTVAPLMRFVTQSRSKGHPSRGSRDCGGAGMPRAMENWWKCQPGNDNRRKTAPLQANKLRHPSSAKSFARGSILSEFVCASRVTHPHTQHRDRVCVSFAFNPGPLLGSF